MNNIIKIADKINNLQKRVGGLERIESATITNPFVAVPLAISTVLSWPNLKLFAPPGPMFDNGSTRYIQNLAITGSDQHLAINGVPKLKLTDGHRPTMVFSGSGQWAYSGDKAHWDILGTETYVQSAFRGLTMWTWVKFDTDVVNHEYVISKRMGSTNLSYHLGRDASGRGTFGISNNGTTDIQITSGADIVDGVKWVFMAGRFDPSIENKLWLNDQTYINTTSIPASIYNSPADLFIAGRDDATTPGQRLLDGTMSMFGFCGAYLPDETINNFYNLTKNIYDTLWTP